MRTGQEDRHPVTVGGHGAHHRALDEAGAGRLDRGGDLALSGRADRIQVDVQVGAPEKRGHPPSGLQRLRGDDGRDHDVRPTGQILRVVRDLDPRGPRPLPDLSATRLVLEERVPGHALRTGPDEPGGDP